MAKVILDIPKEKMASFLNLIVSLGIDKHAIASHPSTISKKKRIPSLSKFLLFDWEFFNNELEFE
jgi:hypothetical protein